MSGEEARTYPERIWAGHLGGGKRTWKPELSHESEKAFACEYVRADALQPLLEALKAARREIKALHRELPVKPARYELDVLEKIDAAIAAATGQPTAAEPGSPENSLP